MRSRQVDAIEAFLAPPDWGKSVKTIGMIAQAHFQAFPDEVQWTIYGNLKVLSCGLCKVLESGPREP